VDLPSAAGSPLATRSPGGRPELLQRITDGSLCRNTWLAPPIVSTEPRLANGGGAVGESSIYIFSRHDPREKTGTDWHIHADILSPNGIMLWHLPCPVRPVPCNSLIRFFGRLFFFYPLPTGKPSVLNIIIFLKKTLLLQTPGSFVSVSRIRLRNCGHEMACFLLFFFVLANSSGVDLEHLISAELDNLMK
jgi:hypothetical protein